MITISRLEYEDLKREISDLCCLVQQLRAEITLLKGGKDSRTSSTAPSHDIGRSNRISLRVSTGKKPGGQSGHPGATLFMSDTPDETINHHPLLCEHCGEDLHHVVSKSFIRRQESDTCTAYTCLALRAKHKCAVTKCKQSTRHSTGISNLYRTPLSPENLSPVQFH